MEWEQYLKFLKKCDTYKEYKNAIRKGEIVPLIKGDPPYLQTWAEPAPFDPARIIHYLHIYIKEGLFEPDTLFKALKTIEVKDKLSLWLILFYIDSYLTYLTHPWVKDRLVVIDINTLADKARELAKVFKGDATVRGAVERIHQKLGRRLFDLDG